MQDQTMNFLHLKRFKRNVGGHFNVRLTHQHVKKTMFSFNKISMKSSHCYEQYI
jgi:hypothetical protein